MVVDAGGGTVDISSYVFKSSAPLSVEETSSPDCECLLIVHTWRCSQQATQASCLGP